MKKSLKLLAILSLTAVVLFAVLPSRASAGDWEIPSSTGVDGRTLYAEIYSGIMRLRVIDQNGKRSSGPLSAFPVSGLPWQSPSVYVGIKEIYFERGITALNDLLTTNLSGAEIYHIPVSLTDFGNNGQYLMKVKTIYYEGTEEQWKALTKGVVFGFGLKAPEVFFECEEKPDPDEWWWVGKDEKSVMASLYGDTLYLEGRGQMRDYAIVAGDDRDLPPWYDSAEKIKHVVVCDGVRNIGNAAFWNNRKIEDITMAGSVTYIGTNAFYHTALKKVQIPESVTEIRDFAFDSCQDLETVYIPQNVGKIGRVAFLSEQPLTVYYDGSPKSWAYIDKDSDNPTLDKATMVFDTAPEDNENQIAPGGCVPPYCDNHVLLPVTIVLAALVVLLAAALTVILLKKKRKQAKPDSN